VVQLSAAVVVWPIPMALLVVLTRTTPQLLLIYSLISDPLLLLVSDACVCLHIHLPQHVTWGIALFVLVQYTVTSRTVMAQHGSFFLSRSLSCFHLQGE
jgi:hypothetical protein